MCPAPISTDETDGRFARWAVTIAEEHDHGLPFMHGAGARALPDLAIGYRVQEKFVELLKNSMTTAIAGYKIGMTSPRMQAACGIDHMIFGRLLASRMTPTGAAMRRFDRLGLECEFAVRLGRDIRLGDPVNLISILASVDGICPAFEVVCDRRADYKNLNVVELVADNVWNHGAVLGKFRPLPEALVDIVCEFRRDDELVAAGTGREVSGHPLNPLVWLASTLQARGEWLREGEIVLTGSLFPIAFPDAASRFSFHIAGLGSVELDIHD